MKEFLLTYTGKKLDILNPKKSQIDIKDIAKGLSQLCRYSGQIERFYSVAQHCCYVAEIVKENRLGALLHDASEAYISDIPSPVKRCCPQIKELENNIQKVIKEKYLCDFDDPDIKLADELALATEFRDLLHRDPEEFGLIKPIKNVKIKSWSSEYAEKRFLRWFYDNEPVNVYKRAYACNSPFMWPL